MSASGSSVSSSMPSDPKRSSHELLSGSDPKRSSHELLSGSDPVARALPVIPSDPEAESDALTPSNINEGRTLIKATMGDGVEENETFQAENSPALAPELPSVMAGVDIEPAAETENSFVGDVRTPPQPEKEGIELAITPSSLPDWLPAGWVEEIKIRTSGATAGTKDRYFYDPVSHRRFRSKKEVFNFLETGPVGRSRTRSETAESDANHTVRPRSKAVESAIYPTPSHSSRSHKLGGSVLKQKSAVKFDFMNRPAKVKWVLSSSAEGLWTPYIGDEELPESSKKSWAAEMEFVSSGPHEFQD